MAVNTLSRAIRANERHKTRFHTERGELLPLAAVPSAARSILTRIGPKKAPSSPWIAPSAINFLEHHLVSSQTLLEFGSGSSTVWYSKRVGSVISLENDPTWYENVSDQVREEALKNCSVRFIDTDAFINEVEAMASESLDVVIVDAIDPTRDFRPALIEASHKKVRPNGFLLLDDSDRPEYASVDTILKGWQVHRFVGVKPQPLTAVETSIYVKPS